MREDSVQALEHADSPMAKAPHVTRALTRAHATTSIGATAAS